MKIIVTCDWCGKEFEKQHYQVKPHNFCSRSCMAAFSSKSKNPNGYAELKRYDKISAHMTEVNKRLNSTRMTPAVREKLRVSRLGSGAGKGYAKCYGKAEHRIAAEQKLGRPLRPGEVVHHLDGNKRNNNPENLIVFSSQADHARWHKKAGDLK